MIKEKKKRLFNTDKKKNDKGDILKKILPFKNKKSLIGSIIFSEVFKKKDF